MERLIIMIVALLLFNATTCNASWLVFHKPEFKGKIVDIETNEPIEGAVVVAIYRKVQMAIGDAVDRNIGAQEKLTDKNGEFTIPPYTAFMNPFSWDNTVDFYIFKPGYASLGPAYLEEDLNGTGKREVELSASWNHSLKYRIKKSGIIMLPKVTVKDRIEGFRKLSWDPELTNKLPIASSMKLIENRYILTLE